jgi:chromosome segregation ATPase
MRNLVILLLSVFTLVSCGKKEDSKKYLRATNDSLTIELLQRETEMNELMAIFNEVQESFRQISNAEDRVEFTRGDAIAENAISVRQQITADIEFITTTMAENRKQISKLQKMLNKSKGNVSELKKAVAKLSEELVEKTKRIEELQEELASKNIRIQELDAAVAILSADKESLEAENEAKSKVVAEQDRTINTAWFVFGTKSELKKQKILQGNDVLQSADFNKDYFTQIDIRTQKEIKLYSKHAELLTVHPKNSYRLEKDNEGLLVLKITKVVEFWSVSNYLVIQVK